jgi:hypothetical protein
MADLSFRDRFLTRPVAETLLAPSSILVAGAGASVAIVAGLPLLAAPLVGAAAWALRVVAAVPRNQRRARIDPSALPEPWRRFVVEALKAQVRYEQALAGAEAGPIRDRLRLIGERIDDGVLEAWRIARRGAQLVDARAGIDADEARGTLAQLEARDVPPGSAAERTIQALRSQIDAAARLDNTIVTVRDQLQLLDARLDESVARAAELSVRIGDAAELGPVGADVDGLVQEMEALRLALEETTSGTGLPGPDQAAGA